MERIQRFLTLLAVVALSWVASSASHAQFNETIVETAVNEEGSGKAYFFLGDQYVIYDWARDRAVDGVHPITDWGLAPALAPLNAALDGKKAYRGYSYFFKGADYLRFKWGAPRGLDPLFSRPLALWNLPAPFNSGVDAAFNGKFARDGRAYFFRGSQYIRYDWTTDRGDPAESIARMAAGMPASFAAGIDAAVDGDGPFANYGYLFKKDQYVRFNWDRGGTNFRIDSGPRTIHQNWPGLAELLLAGKAKSQALAWLGRAKEYLAAYVANIELGTPFPLNATLMREALATHFHIPAASPAAERAARAKQILATYALVEATLHQSPTRLRYRSDPEAQADGGWDAASSQPHHAYAFFQGTVNVSRLFPTYGPLARAAQILHEAVHVVDNQSGSSTTHIPEWYVTAAEATRLGLPFQPDNPALAHRYDMMTFADAVHNPSSYAAFAQHLSYASDTRYGAGKPTQ